MRPTTRQRRLFDVAAVALALLGAFLSLGPQRPVLPVEAAAWWWVDLAAGLAAAALMPARRRAPVAVFVVVWLLSAVTTTAWIASCVTVFGLAVRRPWPLAAGLSVVSLLTVPVTGLVRAQAPASAPSWTTLGWLVLVTALLLASGLAVRARQALMASLVERAERAESEAALRAEAARTAERTRIAREMHDVLAHRLSLVSMHAGALAHRHHPSREEVAEALEVIRSGARDALGDLRTVLGVLRDPATGAAGAETAGHVPQPTPADLERLLDGMRAAGTSVRWRDEIADGALDSLPDDCARALYRVTQEALTNAARHAPGQPVEVTLRGSPGATAELEVSNPLPAPTGTNGVSEGAGSGLLGITERVDLAGGRVLARGPERDRFRVAVSLPWPVGS